MRWTVAGPEVVRCLENFENGISATTKIIPNRKRSRITSEIYIKNHINKIIADFGNLFFETCPELIALEATCMFCFSNRGIRGTWPFVFSWIMRTYKHVNKTWQKQFSGVSLVYWENKKYKLKRSIVLMNRLCALRELLRKSELSSTRNTCHLSSTISRIHLHCPNGNTQSRYAKRHGSLKATASCSAVYYIGRHQQDEAHDDFFMRENQTYPPSLFEFVNLRYQEVWHDWVLDQRDYTVFSTRIIWHCYCRVQ